MGTQTAIRPLMNADELAEFPDDGFQYELDDGELIMMAPAGEEHGRIEGDVFGLLYAEVRKRGLGRLYSSDTGFVLRENPDIVRCPDVSFVRKERLPLPVTSMGFIRGAPDLAVEVRSPSQSPADLNRKTRQYLDNGADTVWVVFPREKKALVRDSSGSEKTLTLDGFMEAPRVLPCVRIALREVFQAP
jgi:Uma2 family endonuclease